MIDNIVGKRFNRLTVISETPKRTKARTKIFLCKCDCGNFKEIAREKLRHGTKSCGCLKYENIKNRSGTNHQSWQGYEEISKSFFTRIKLSAEKRNYSFNLKIEDLWDLFLVQDKKCALSGRKLQFPKKIRDTDKDSDYNIPSLDRINNSKGYEIDNIQWLCFRVNYMKHVLDEQVFLSYIADIYSFKIKK